jgi:hypothetical protein
VRAGFVTRTDVAAAADVDLADARDADKAFILRDLDGTGMTFSFWAAGRFVGFLGGEGR